MSSSITSLQNDLLEKKITAEAHVSNYLDRIKKHDKTLNSFITVCEGQALDEAKQIDKLIELKGKEVFLEKPLLGTVVSHKDIYLTKGIKTTAGANLLKDFVPQYSSTVVENLKHAGAITIGKTNLDAWAHGSSGENSDFGPSHNPWNTDYVPGGSSSGAAVSVAAQFCDIATATDTCGSIRLPANFCGVVGLKPTYGVVSRYGVISMASSLDSMGLMGKSALDVKLAFNIMKGEDKKDGTLSKSSGGKSNIKVIGIPEEFFGEGLDPEIQKNIDEVIKTLKSLGIEFKSVQLPHTKYGISVYYIIQPAEVSSNLGRFDGIRFGEDRSAFSAEAKRRIMLGTYVLSSGYREAYYLKAMKVRSKIIQEIENVFEDVDALLAPVAPTSAFKLGEKSNDPLKMYLTDIYASTANLAGIPSVAIPSGFAKNGLPLGFQLMGSRFSDEAILDLASKYQTEINYKFEAPRL